MVDVIVSRELENINSDIDTVLKSTNIVINSKINYIKSTIINFLDTNKLIIKRIVVSSNYHDYMIRLDIENKDEEHFDYSCFEYDLYRSTNAYEAFKLIASNQKIFSEYLDRDINTYDDGCNYYYKVKIRNRLTGEEVAI